MTEGAAYIWILERLLMVQDLRGPADAYRAMQHIDRLREFGSSGMTHIGTDNFLRLYDKRIHAGSKEIDKILEAEKGLASELDKKMEQSMRDQNQDSVEESWLSMLVDSMSPTDYYNNSHGGLNGSLQQGESSMSITQLISGPVSRPFVMQ
ncbi:uncharacterized protein N7473_010562 [Penicillium subrubescens]|uniref:uncharacterized protein n=1 Tax=Penicillium subrubescens TaxID=1316194 RepID=UPI0025450F89|nr:uncharacterized protein N7473_010562 [Penicillium subrubescens]KAJ5883676.1 hypothetical protein N7473_010562 [Penicillium subrubescens]